MRIDGVLTMNEQYAKARVSTGTTYVPDFTLLGDEDLYLFNEGSHLSLYEKLGAHPCQVENVGKRGIKLALTISMARPPIGPAA